MNTALVGGGGGVAGDDDDDDMRKYCLVKLWRKCLI